MDEADKLLDIGLGFNFRVREHPLYFLTKARLEKRANRVDQSIEQLRNALDLFAKSLFFDMYLFEIIIELIYYLKKNQNLN